VYEQRADLSISTLRQGLLTRPSGQQIVEKYRRQKLSLSQTDRIFLQNEDGKTVRKERHRTISFRSVATVTVANRATTVGYTYSTDGGKRKAFVTEID
jgi:hypothetical protein